jgi:hypothetical protein
MATSKFDESLKAKGIARLIYPDASDKKLSEYAKVLREKNDLKIGQAIGAGTDVKLGKGIKYNPAPAGSRGASEVITGPDANANAFEGLNILDDPLYQEALRAYYNESYIPGLTQSQFGIGQSRNAMVENDLSRSQAQREAIQRTAGNYASRGFRSPKMVTKDFSKIQGATAAQKRAEEASIAAQQNQQDVLYGAGGSDLPSFLKDPTRYGSIGAGARRASLSNLSQLSDQYRQLGLGY